MSPQRVSAAVCCVCVLRVYTLFPSRPRDASSLARARVCASSIKHPNHDVKEWLHMRASARKNKQCAREWASARAHRRRTTTTAHANSDAAVNAAISEPKHYAHKHWCRHHLHIMCFKLPLFARASAVQRTNIAEHKLIYMEIRSPVLVPSFIRPCLRPCACLSRAKPLRNDIIAR